MRHAFVFAVFTLVLCSAFAAHARPPWGTGESRGEDLKITLITFGTGDDVASWFGHSSLVVEDMRLKQNRLYNYGEFSFDRLLLLRYASGHLEFWVGERDAQRTIDVYRRANRDVRAQVLSLTPSERLELATFLSNNALPENRKYIYDHYSDNCATRPRDIIDRVLKGQLRKASEGPARFTLRGHTRRHTSVSPPMAVLIDYLLNDRVDQPITNWDEQFLPAELESRLRTLEVVHDDGTTGPIVESESIIFKAQRAPTAAAPPSYTLVMFAIGALIAVVANVAARKRAVLGIFSALVGLALGIPAVALFVIATFTDHSITFGNENLLALSVAVILAFPFGLAYAAGRATTLTPLLWLVLSAAACVAALLKLVPAFDQDNHAILALVVPTLAGIALAFLRRRARVGA